MTEPTFTEAAAISGIPEGVLRKLAVGPLAPNDDGRVPLRKLLALSLSASLAAHRAMSIERLVAVADEAMKGAQLDGGRALVVSFKEAQPMLIWADFAELLRQHQDAQFSAPIRAPHFVVPCDAMLSDLVTSLQQLRAAGTRLH